MSFRTLGDRIIVKRDAVVEKKSASGLIMPESTKEIPNTGVIKSTSGEGLEPQKGDRIIFDQYAGSSVIIDGEEYLYMSEKDIIVILEK